MKFKSSLFLFLFYSILSNAQSNFCTSATTIVVTANCTSPLSGSTVGATQSLSGCSGNADDDVWYKFVATTTAHVLTVSSSASFDAVVELFSGTCATLSTLSCKNQTGNAGTEIIFASGLTIGNTYFIRVYHSGVMHIVKLPEPAPTPE